MRREMFAVLNLALAVTLAVAPSAAQAAPTNPVTIVADKCIKSLGDLAAKHSGVRPESKADALAFLASSEVAEALTTAALDTGHLPIETLSKLQLCEDLVMKGQMMRASIQ